MREFFTGLAMFSIELIDYFQCPRGRYNTSWHNGCSPASFRRRTICVHLRPVWSMETLVSNTRVDKHICVS